MYTDLGTIKRFANGDPVPRGTAPTPCDSCAKVPTWAKVDGKRTASELRVLASDMSFENMRAFARYKEYRATLGFPDDPLVRWYSGIIGEIYDEWAREPHVRSAELVKHLVSYLLLKGRR